MTKAKYFDMTKFLHSFRTVALRAWRPVALVVSFGLLVFYFVWSDSAEVRYRYYYTSHYKMIYGEKGPVNLVSMGSSRAQCMFGAHEWQERLAKEQNQFIVYNLATSQRGKGFHYTVLRDIIENRKVSSIMLHMNNTDQRTPVHPWFYMVARHGDILKSMWFDTGQPWHKRISSGLKIFLKKHTTIIEDYLLSKLYLVPKSYQKPKPAKTGDALTANMVTPHSLHKVKAPKDWKKYLATGFFWDLDDEKEERNTRFLAEIVNMAQRKGVHIEFFYVPKLYGKILSDKMVSSIEKKFGTKTLQPSKNKISEFFPSAFADAGHGSDKGRRIYSDMAE